MLSADTSSAKSTASDSSPSSAGNGAVPDLSGVVVGSRADTSPPLQGAQPGLTSGKLTGYVVPAPKPFMGFPLTGNSLVSVDGGKIVDVTNNIDPASCPKLQKKLTAMYGPQQKIGLRLEWTAGPAQIAVTTVGGGCNVSIQLPD